MVITVLTIDCGAVHRVVIHGDDPGVFSSLLRLVGSLQILLQPSILLTNQIQSVPDEEVEL